MTVAELIEALKKMPPDVQVRFIDDGCMEGEIEEPYLEDGKVWLNDTWPPHRR